MKNLTNIFIGIILVLMVFSAVIVFSASGTYSAHKYANFYWMFKSHIGKEILAIAAMFIFSFVPYKYYKKYSKYALMFVIVLLLSTLLFSAKVKGASRWINLGFVQFQPSELAKLVLLVHLAVLIEKKGKLIKDFKNGFIYALVWIFLIAFLVLVQPKFGTALIILITGFTLLFISGAKVKHIFFTLFSVSIVFASLMMIFPYSRERVFTFVNSILHGGEINDQVRQAKIGLGSGGFWGVGLGGSRQSDLFLPESYGDFIFSILGEETGFIGSMFLLFAYLTVFALGVIVAKKAETTFGQLLAFGLALNIIVSAFVNIAVVVGVLPTTGITLPFISFGGTSIILFGVSAGIIVNIGRETYKRKELRLARG